ncbi:hypothetical protein CEE45_16785 [Candidatus Heimdallarchaeota archaeon B3_Heim]|nr:MAG: hypothetical protein CEE45_16785 [Candidatus Heimdallarchaeota archaeon B3_Heim]
MNISTKIRIGILLVVGLPTILGVGLIVANQLNPLSLADDYRVIQPIDIDRSAYIAPSGDGFNFLHVELDGDLLTIEVSYRGGQNQHDFVLIGAGDFMESSPIQTALVLSHNSNGDLGEALITKELIFDLKPLKEAFLMFIRSFLPMEYHFR